MCSLICRNGILGGTLNIDENLRGESLSIEQMGSLSEKLKENL